MGGTQALFLIEYGAHQIRCAQDALHQEVSLALGAERHGLCGAVGIRVGGNDLIGIGILVLLPEHAANLVSMAHQNGSGNALTAGGNHGLNDGLIVGSRYGDDTAGTAFGGVYDALNGVNHENQPPYQGDYIVFQGRRQ